MMLVFAFLTAIAGTYALTNPPITGETPPPVPCPNSLCAHKPDGNHNYHHYGQRKDNYFVQCVNGNAYCQACWPLTLKFSKKCNQCVYNLYDPCTTTVSWVPEKRYPCPDDCPKKGPNFSGNIMDSYNKKHYIGCWKGMTMGCVNCPSGLLFNEEWNACLYEGKYFTRPVKPHH